MNSPSPTSCTVSSQKCSVRLKWSVKSEVFSKTLVGGKCLTTVVTVRASAVRLSVNLKVSSKVGCNRVYCSSQVWSVSSYHKECMVVSSRVCQVSSGHQCESPEVEYSHLRSTRTSVQDCVNPVCTAESASRKVHLNGVSKQSTY